MTKEKEDEKDSNDKKAEKSLLEIIETTEKHIEPEMKNLD